MKFIYQLLITIFIGIISIATMFIFARINQFENTIKETKKSELIYYSREEINNLLKNTNRAEVIKWLTTYTRNEEVTDIIFSGLINSDIPIILGFSWCWAESEYNPAAIGRNEKSHDIGLWQLNSYWYQQYNHNFLMNPRHNTRLATERIQYSYYVYHDWNKAILKYNCGNLKAVPEKTVNYLNRILKREQLMTADFCGRFLK